MPSSMRASHSSSSRPYFTASSPLSPVGPVILDIEALGRSSDKPDPQPQPVTSDLRKPRHQPSVLSMVRQREAILGLRVVHPLHQFTQRAEEIVHLLRPRWRFA